jgi:hypothetical protein
VKISNFCFRRYERLKLNSSVEFWLRSTLGIEIQISKWIHIFKLEKIKFELIWVESKTFNISILWIMWNITNLMVMISKWRFELIEWNLKDSTSIIWIVWFTTNLVSMISKLRFDLFKLKFIFKINKSINNKWHNNKNITSQ